MANYYPPRANKQKSENEMIFGIRAIIEAIAAGKEIDKILIKKDLNGELVQELFQLIKQEGLVTQRVPLEKLNRLTMKNHQGVIAFISAVTYYALDQVLPNLFEEGKTPFIVALDGITDVRNFGAIARTCECAGVDAIVLPKHDSVTVSADAVKTSAGALHRIPVCREPRLIEAIKYMQFSGLQVIAASEKGAVNYTEVDYSIPTVLVMGAEDTGVSEECLKLCNQIVAIPQKGNIGSLNVSVAAGVLIYEVIRQRG